MSNQRMDKYARSSLIALILSLSAIAQQTYGRDQTGHLVNVGARKMFLNCTGSTRAPTVILEAGTGDSSEVWNVVQKQVEQFAPVCSYDRLGLGKSDRLTARRTANEIVSDLHDLLQAAHVVPPYVMVGHSIGGIYVRKYAALYPREVIGLVLADSAHEEQFARVSQISPEWAGRIHDRFPADEQVAQGFLQGNERLTWHFDGPLVVIEHGQMPPSAASDPMAKQSEAVFYVLQKDLAGRSKYGQLREAKKSGHYIQRDEPEVVTQSVKDVIRESPTLFLQTPL